MVNISCQPQGGEITRGILWGNKQVLPLQTLLGVQDACLWARGLCQGLTQSGNTGVANRLTFGKGTELIIQPCKCFYLGGGNLRRGSVGTFSNPVCKYLVQLPSPALFWVYRRHGAMWMKEVMQSVFWEGTPEICPLSLYMTTCPLWCILDSHRQKICTQD